MFELLLDNRSYILKSGDAALINCASMHRGVPTDAIYECVVFSLSMLYKKSNDIVRKFLRPISHNRVSVKNIPDKAALAVINKLFDASKSTDELFSMQIHSLLFELFYTLYKGGAVTKDKNKHKNEKQLSVLTGLMDWIDSNLTESITLAQLSQISGMNEKYLCRFFKEYTGKTPIDYVNYLRIEAACQELDETDLSVTDAAIECGFNSISYFTKTFKKYKSISPSQYRKNKLG